MLRKFGLSVLLLAASISANAYSPEQFQAKQSVTMDFEFIPNVPQEFVNYMFWELTANCKMSTPDASDEFLIEALAKTGTVNGAPLSNGQSMRISIHNSETLKLTAVSGAKVSITNKGPHTVKATCST